MRTKRSELESVIYELHSSKIRVGFQTFSGGIEVWISDALYHVREDCVFDHANPVAPDNSVALWLHFTALRLFPNSDYALGHRHTHDRADAPTNARETGLPSST